MKKYEKLNHDFSKPINELKKKYGEEMNLSNQLCYICNFGDFTRINNIDRYGLFYPTGICNNCGNVQQEAYFTNDVLIDIYENFYHKIFNPDSVENIFHTMKHTRAQSIYKYVTSIAKPKKVLEVGCGAGGILSLFLEKGCDVLGLDYDENKLNFAKKNGVNVRKGSIEKLECNQKYDLIILSHVLEHIVNPKDFLVKLHQHLNQDGVLYIEVPSLEFVKNGGYFFELSYYWQFAHTIHFTKKSLQLLLNQAGFNEIKKTDYIQSCWSKIEPIIIKNQKFQELISYNRTVLNEIEKNKNKKFSLKKFNILIKNIIKLTIKKLGLNPILYLYYRFK